MAETGDHTQRIDAVARDLDVAGLRDLLSRGLDYGCRPQVRRADDGSYTLLVIGTAEQLDGLRRDGFVLEPGVPPDRSRYAIGEGDRFAGGTVVPRGLGEKVAQPTRRAEWP
jgi:hypothetical protein